MEDRVTLEPPTDDAALEAAISRLIEEMKDIHTHMERVQADIEAMKAESRALRAHRDRVKAETRAVLATLKTVE
jgi:SMC interacting uncharacterized protein involved in chromosome segregation